MPTAAGFPPAAFDFLRGLAANNAKPWFEANRHTFEAAVKQPMAALIAAVSAELARRGVPLEGDPKRSGFRIHRDVRFSADKSPYKTQIGAVWYRQGSGKDGAGVLYFHLAAEGCFTAAAFYHPEPDVLDSIRERIRVHPERFLAMQGELASAGLQLSPADSLTRMPKGYEDLKAAEIAPALRLRSFLVKRDLTSKQVHGPGLIAAVATMGADAMPLLRFGWDAGRRGPARRCRMIASAGRFGDRSV